MPFLESLSLAQGPSPKQTPLPKTYHAEFVLERAFTYQGRRMDNGASVIDAV